MIDFRLFSKELIEFFRYAAIAGFIAATALIININYATFNKIFKEKTKLFWTLFFISALIPLLVSIYIFSLLFERSKTTVPWEVLRSIRINTLFKK